MHFIVYNLERLGHIKPGKVFKKDLHLLLTNILKSVGLTHIQIYCYIKQGLQNTNLDQQQATNLNHFYQLFWLSIHIGIIKQLQHPLKLQGIQKVFILSAGQKICKVTLSYTVEAPEHLTIVLLNKSISLPAGSNLPHQSFAHRMKHISYLIICTAGA